MEMKNEAWKQWGCHTLSILLLFISSQKQILKCLLLDQLWMGLLLEHEWVLETTWYKYKWKTFILLWINVCCGKKPWAEQEEILCPSDVDTSALVWWTLTRSRWLLFHLKGSMATSVVGGALQPWGNSPWNNWRDILMFWGLWNMK